MLKRTKGYTLLLLLVLTGLAGRLSTTTITSKERRIIIDELKASKLAVLKSVKNLSEKQLNFKASVKEWSIKDCLQHLAFAEEESWGKTVNVLKRPFDPNKNHKIKLSDEKALFVLTSTEQEEQKTKNLKKQKAIGGDTEQILNAFKTKRNELIKFAKTSTDDMRNRVIQFPVGSVDAYQMILFIAAHTKHYLVQIEKIKANSAFPK